MYDVIITDHAEVDLECLAQDLTDRASVSVALRYIGRIRKACDSLSLMPYRFAVNPELGGSRKVVVSPYLVFYRVEDDNVFVLRILHGKQDITEDWFRK